MVKGDNVRNYARCRRLLAAVATDAPTSHRPRLRPRRLARALESAVVAALPRLPTVPATLEVLQRLESACAAERARRCRNVVPSSTDAGNERVDHPACPAAKRIARDIESAAASDAVGSDVASMEQVPDDDDWEGPLEEADGIVEHGSVEWGRSYWCHAVAGETLRLSSRYRPCQSSQPLRFEVAPTEMKAAATSSAAPLNRTFIEVTGEDSLEAAKRLIQSDRCKDSRPLVLNMASPSWPGGGFLRGADGQEEELCRRSTLFCELAEAEYPLPDTGALVSSDVVVMRGQWPTYAELEIPYHVAVITAAAPRNPDVSTADAAAKYEELMAIKVEALLRICAAVGYRCLVLSAWGCGAFKNPPATVARLFRETLGKSWLCSHFEHIVFAVYDRPSYGEANCEVFQQAFADWSHRTPESLSNSVKQTAAV